MQALQDSLKKESWKIVFKNPLTNSVAGLKKTITCRPSVRVCESLAEQGQSIS